MNCPECEQLFDAYLDGQLAGTLRLEFDAHRLRCPRCQQTLAMLEAAGHVIASDAVVPELSPDFTDRIMQAVAAPAPRIVRFPSTRVALFAAAIVQVAAVVSFVVLWPFGRTPVVPSAPTDVTAKLAASIAEHPDRALVYRSIVEGIEDHFWEMHAAGRQLTTDVLQMARYLDIQVPDDVVRESTKVAEVNPWQALWDTLQPREVEEPEPAVTDDEIRSI
jgi:hypothetical protein